MKKDSSSYILYVSIFGFCAADFGVNICFVFEQLLVLVNQRNLVLKWTVGHIRWCAIAREENWMYTLSFLLISSLRRAVRL